MQSIVNLLIKGDKVLLGSDSQAPMGQVVAKGALTAAVVSAAGGVLKLQNTTGYDLYVELFMIDVTTKSTGVATLDIGVDSIGTTSNDSLIDGVDVSTAPIIASNVVGGGTNGKIVRWKKDEYIVATASATVAGMVGTFTLKASAV